MRGIDEKAARVGVTSSCKPGGKFDSESYKVAGGLHGVGVSVVNALSEWLEADVYRDGIHYHFECFRGARKGDVKKIGTTDKRGTKIAFKPDEEIFGDTEFDYDTILKRIREMAYLNGGLKISFRDDRADKKESFKFDDGIRAFVNHLNEGKEILHKDVIYTDQIYFCCCVFSTRILLPLTLTALFSPLVFLLPSL